jgi:hypothetical protein
MASVLRLSSIARSCEITARQFGLVGVAQNRQGAADQHRQQDDFNRGYAQYGFAAKAHASIPLVSTGGGHGRA